MADNWLPSATRKSWADPNRPGSTWWDGNADVRANPLLILHTTEGHDSCPGYQNGAGVAGGYAPNFTIVVKARQFFQHIPLNRAGRALPYYNNSGIQVEITGSCSIAWAKQAGLVYVGDFTADDLAWIEQCLDLIREAAGIPGTAGARFASYEDLAAGKTSVRLTVDQLAAARGIVAHQNIPSGGHIDAGILGPVIVSGSGTLPPPAPVEQDAAPLTKDDILAWQKSYSMPVCDGVISAPVSAFVERLQRDIGKGSLVVDGILGPMTRAAICASLRVATWDDVPAALRATLAPQPAPAPAPAPKPAPAPAPKPKPTGPNLTVDGIYGINTRAALMANLHASAEVWAVRWIQQQLNAHGYRGLDGKPLLEDGRAFASNASGDVGPYQTIAALQRAYGTPVDGVWSKGGSECVRALQRHLNNGKVL